MSRYRRLEERQIAAGVTAAALLIAVPIVFILALLMASGWVAAFGGHPHRMLWGWLSSTTRDAQGHTIWDVGRVPVFYLFGVLNACVVYEITEGLRGAFVMFKRALA